MRDICIYVSKVYNRPILILLIPKNTDCRLHVYPHALIGIYSDYQKQHYNQFIALPYDHNLFNVYIHVQTNISVELNKNALLLYI